MMTPDEFETRFLNLDVMCQTRAEMIVAYRALWERERDNSDYISALCRAIESHCRGVAVPDDTAARCPYHAKMLNEHRMTEIGPTSETNAARAARAAYDAAYAAYAALADADAARAARAANTAVADFDMLAIAEQATEATPCAQE